MSENTRGPRPFPWPCSQCGTLTVVPTLTNYTARVKHDGAIHELRLPNLEVPTCQTCGETTITTAIDDRINDVLRVQLQLLSPEQIQKEIKHLGLEHQEIAVRLGVATDTISRWASGSLIPSRAMDNLLRVFFASPEARQVLRGASPRSDERIPSLPAVAKPGLPT